MHFTKYLAGLLILAGAGAGIGDAARAGGFDRNDQSIDLIFQPGNRVEIRGRGVFPNRSVAAVSATVNGVPVSGTSNPNVAAERFFPGLAVKIGLSDAFDCMASLTHPYGTFSDYGTGWAGRYTATKTRLDAEDVGLLCRAAVAVGPGRASLLAGVRHEAADGQLKRAVNTGVGDVLTGVTAKSRGVGYSVGLAYEIPEAAFRAQIVYYSQIDHRLEGAATIENINAPAAVFRVLQATRLTDVTADLPTPGSVVGHARLGIAPDWQIAGTIRWVNWSVLRSFAIRSANGTADFDTPLHLQNSATYSLGVGHAVTPSLSVRGFAFLDEDSAQDATRSPISPGGQSVGLGFGASYRFEAGPTVTGTVVGSRSDTVSVTQTSTSFGQTSDIRIRYDATYTAGLELGVTFPF